MAKQKVTLYFHDEMLSETQREAVRLDRSVSWIIQAAWRVAKDQLDDEPREGAGADADADEQSNELAASGNRSR